MNGFSAADMSTAAANGHAEGYKAGYADAVKAIEAASTPPAPGIDLEQFREAVAHWKRDLHDDYKGGHIHDGGEAMRKADRMLRLIDDSQNGGKCCTCEGHGMIGGLLPAGGGCESEPCPDCSPKGGSDAESRFAFCAKHETFPVRTGDGRHWIMFVATDPARPNVRAVHSAATPEAAIDAAMQATSAEVGS